METLTRRQTECLRMSVALTDKEIARTLGIAPKTVDGHIHAAMRRLGVSSRRTAALMLLADVASAEATNESRPSSDDLEALVPVIQALERRSAEAVDLSELTAALRDSGPWTHGYRARNSLLGSVIVGVSSAGLLAIIAVSLHFSDGFTHLSWSSAYTHLEWLWLTVSWLLIFILSGEKFVSDATMSSGTADDVTYARETFALALGGAGLLTIVFVAVLCAVLGAGAHMILAPVGAIAWLTSANMLRAREVRHGEV